MIEKMKLRFVISHNSYISHMNSNITVNQLIEHLRTLDGDALVFFDQEPLTPKWYNFYSTAYFNKDEEGFLVDEEQMKERLTEKFYESDLCAHEESADDVNFNRKMCKKYVEVNSANYQKTSILSFRRKA